MSRDVTVIGQYAAGRDIHLQVELTPESAQMVAEALLQLQKKNEFPHCVINPISTNKQRLKESDETTCMDAALPFGNHTRH